MGYTTDFTGRFDLDRPLASEHFEYLKAFSETRRMKRDPGKAERLPDPVRKAAGLPIGDEGEYFVGGGGYHGQDQDTSIVNYNDEPASQFSLWCDWAPTEDGQGIEWNGTEKFYSYVEWLEYLIGRFLKPWGYVLNGTVEYQGEDPADFGKIIVTANAIETQVGKRVYRKKAH